MVQIVEVVSDHIPWDLCGHDPDCPDRAYWHAGHARVYDRDVSREHFEGCVYL